MPVKDPEQKEREIAEAAFWRVARPELTIGELAALLTLTRSSFERRVEAAKEKGWIHQDWILKVVPGLLSEVLSKTKDSYLEQEIRRYYGIRQLPELTVVPGWPPKGTTFSPPEEEIAKVNMRMVAHAAASVFLQRLPKMKYLGLSYGRTLKEMIDCLERFSTEVKKILSENDKIGKRTIFTVFGSLSFHFQDTRHGEWLENCASHLTNRLAGILGPDMCERRFLETPVYVPPAFLDQFKKSTTKNNPSDIGKQLNEAEALQIAKAFVEAIPTYHDLFAKGQESAIEKLDTVITSVGDLETGFGSLPKGEAAPLLREEEIEKLRNEAVGDIAGCYVTEEGKTGKSESTIAKVNARIFGLKIEDLEKVASRAEKNGAPGVIVIASSGKKARVISALLNRPNKVISELIISGDLAQVFLEYEADKKEKQKR